MNNRKIGTCIALTLFFLFITSLFAKAQGEDLLTYRITCPDTVGVGDTLMLVLTIDVEPGWYVYAHDEVNEQQGMQPLSITFHSSSIGFKPHGGWKVPESVPEGTYLVYRGEGHVFTGRWVVGEATKSGKVNLEGNILFQACNEHTCYPPATRVMTRQILVR